MYQTSACGSPFHIPGIFYFSKFSKIRIISIPEHYGFCLLVCSFFYLFFLFFFKHLKINISSFKLVAIWNLLAWSMPQLLRENMRQKIQVLLLMLIMRLYLMIYHLRLHSIIWHWYYVFFSRSSFTDIQNLHAISIHFISVSWLQYNKNLNVTTGKEPRRFWQSLFFHMIWYDMII